MFSFIPDLENIVYLFTNVLQTVFLHSLIPLIIWAFLNNVINFEEFLLSHQQKLLIIVQLVRFPLKLTLILLSLQLNLILKLHLLYKSLIQRNLIAKLFKIVIGGVPQDIRHKRSLLLCDRCLFLDNCFVNLLCNIEWAEHRGELPIRLSFALKLIKEVIVNLNGIYNVIYILLVISNGLLPLVFDGLVLINFPGTVNLVLACSL